MDLTGPVLQIGPGFNLYVNITGGETQLNELYVESPDWGFTLYKKQFSTPYTAIFRLMDNLFSRSLQSSIPVTLRVKNDYMEKTKTVYFKIQPAITIGEILFPAGNIYNNEPFTVEVETMSGSEGASYKWYVIGTNFSIYDKINSTWSVVPYGSYVKTQIGNLDLMINEAGNCMIQAVAQNSVSNFTRQNNFTVLENFKGGFVVLHNPAAKPNETVVVNYGFVVGKLISIVVSVEGKPGVMNLVQNHPKVSLNQTFRTVFNESGFYTVAMNFSDSSAQILLEKEVEVIIDRPVVNITLSIIPNQIAYTTEQVTFTIKAYSLSRLRGELHISRDWSSLGFDVILLDFRHCHSSGNITDVCWVATHTHVFDSVMRHTVNGFVSNAVSTVQISSQEIFVFDRPAKTDPQLKIHAQTTALGSPTIFRIIRKNSSVQLDYCTIQPGFGDSVIWSAPVSDDNEITYKDVGVFDVVIECQRSYGNNQKDILKINTTARVQIPLQVKSIEFTRLCVLHGASIDVVVNLLNSSMLTEDVKFSLLVFDNRTIDKAIVRSSPHSITTSVIQSDYQNPGQIPFTLVLANEISQVTEPIEICVKPAIQQVSCHTPKASLSGDIVSFPIEIVSETNVDLRFDYGDNTSVSFTNIDQKRFTTDHIFQSQDVFNYTILVSNNVSQVWCNGTLKTFQKVPNLLFLSSLTDLSTWPNNTVEFYVQFTEEIPPSHMTIDYTIVIW